MKKDKLVISEQNTEQRLSDMANAASYDPPDVEELQEPIEEVEHADGE